MGAVRKEGSGTIWHTTTFILNFYDFYTHHLPKNSPNVSKWPSELVSKEGSKFTTSHKPPLGVKQSVFSLVNIGLRQEPGLFFNKISKNNTLFELQAGNQRLLSVASPLASSHTMGNPTHQ